MCTPRSILIKVENTKQVLHLTFKLIWSVRIPIVFKPVFLRKLVICMKNGQRREGENGDQCDTGSLRNQLKKNVSSLFLKMQAILHVSNTATQEIVDQIGRASCRERV